MGSGAPDQLKWALCGWPPRGPNTFSCDGPVMQFSGGYGNNDRRIPVAEIDWEPFWRVVEEAKLWEWPEWFGSRIQRDGLLYHLNLRLGEREVTAKGQCCEHPLLRKQVLEIHRVLQTMVGYVGEPPGED